MPNLSPKILILYLFLIGIGIFIGYYIENLLEPESLLQKCYNEKEILTNEINTCYLNLEKANTINNTTN